MRVNRLVLALVSVACWTLAGPGAAQTATITTLDAAGDVGHDSSVAYGPNGRALIAYLDQTNHNLKVAACQDTACHSAAVHTIDSSGTVSGSTSIAVGADGRAWIAYRVQTTVKVARCADAECTSATSFLVDTMTQVVRGTAIGVGGDGLGIVAYDNGSSLTVAHCNDANCETSQITALAPHPGLRVSLAIGGDGLALLAGDDTYDMHIGHCSNAACTSATFIVLFGLRFPPSAAIGNYDASLAIGADGNGVVALKRSENHLGTGGDLFMRVYRCLNDVCSSLSAPTQWPTGRDGPALAIRPTDSPIIAEYGYPPGPPPSSLLLYVTECADAACAARTTYSLDTAEEPPAIAVGPDGNGLISYFDVVGADLKVAYLGPSGAELSIGDASVVEGNSATTAAVFQVSLSEPGNVTVQYSTVGLDATPGVDFVAASGTLTFTPGNLTQNVTIQVLGDTTIEPNEQFKVVLSNPQSAVVADPEGFGSIVDDDFVFSPILGELQHGSSYLGDLAARPGPEADVDYFRVVQNPFASYEIVADALSDSLNPLSLGLATGLSDVVSGSPTGVGGSVSMRWRTPSSAAPIVNQVVRISGSCVAACASDAAYRLRAYETTLRGARFNNSATQTTILLLQNSGATPADVSVHFWSPSGALLATYSPAGGAIAAKGLMVLNTALVGGATGATGSLTIAHTAPYGGLAGKTVAVEPSTGLSFDTPLEWSRH